MPNKTTDGTPDAGKLARPVWNGGKGGDYFKALPILLLFSGGKDSLSAYYYLRELGVPKEKIELWHHDLDGGHPKRIMDWPVTLAYVDAFARAEGVRLRVSRRVNGFWGEVFRIGASYPIEYAEDDGTFTVCELSDKQHESDRLRMQIMQEAVPNLLPAF